MNKKQIILIFFIGVFVGVAATSLIYLTSYAINNNLLDSRQDAYVSSSIILDGEPYSPPVSKYFVGRHTITNHGVERVNVTYVDNVDNIFDEISAVISLNPFYIEKTNNETGFKYLVEVDSYCLDVGETLIFWVKP